jgi:DNA-binding NarL/FixJ family response regulator
VYHPPFSINPGAEGSSLERPRAAPTSPTHNSDTQADPRPLGIVLADSHGLCRQGLAALLKAQPDVEILAQVADGEAAWQAIRAHGPQVAILDPDLPRACGIEVVSRVVTAGLGTRCLLLAMHQDPALACQALRAGAAGYVLRENSFEELMLALGSIDAGGTYLSPAIRTKLRDLRSEGHSTLALSPREADVVRLLAAGGSSKEIGRALDISSQTVDTHRRRLMRKLGCHSATEVVSYAARSGLLD